RDLFRPGPELGSVSAQTPPSPPLACRRPFDDNGLLPPRRTPTTCCTFLLTAFRHRAHYFALVTKSRSRPGRPGRGIELGIDLRRLICPLTPSRTTSPSPEPTKARPPKA